LGVPGIIHCLLLEAENGVVDTGLGTGDYLSPSPGESSVAFGAHAVPAFESLCAA
jgi:hypothetical protein